MKQPWLLMALGLVLIVQATAAQKKTVASKPKSAPSVEELILAGKAQDAARATIKTPAKAEEAIRNLITKADSQVTERKIAEAEQTLKSAIEFASAYAKLAKKTTLPLETIQGRQMRIEGIKLSDGKEFAKAEAKLGEALKLSQQISDAALESGIHNNLGFALQNQGKLEEAVKEYDKARKMAEEQKDLWRAASYNFNLGRTFNDLKQFDNALGAFRKTSEQAEAAAKEDLLARGLLWQGITLGKINAISSEATRFFDRAAKLYEKIGDSRNAGWAIYLMADHIAYSQDFDAAARAGERAIPHLTKADDKAGLLKCYEFLQDMYQKLKKNDKMNQYKMLAEEITKQLEKQPNK